MIQVSSLPGRGMGESLKGKTRIAAENRPDIADGSLGTLQDGTAENGTGDTGQWNAGCVLSWRKIWELPTQSG